WTPDTSGLVGPEEVLFLVEALAIRRREVAGTNASIAGAAFLVAAALAWGMGSGPRSGWIVPFALAAAWLATALYESRQARRGGKEAFAAARQQHRHAAWVHSRPATYTWTILFLLTAVMVAEMFGLRDAIEAAGLLKPEVRDGEFWRLLTGALLHGGLMHLAFNLLAFWSLGPLIEAHAGRAMLPIVFLYSALVGSVASLLLIPDVASVGASGGILGLIGFLFVLGYRRRHALPANFVRRMGIGILATAVFGIVGFALVDNATHIGGLLTGMLLAGFLPTDTSDSGSVSRRSLNIVGDVALAIIVLGAVGSIALIYRAIGAS
ncbi:MAG TPA: rhomboid family intramembrane serine protease, partial [Longimicrobiaceae bacterium]|nr:rhomboid family intramembrane serine protease [Longimicrobiaceae bacterium]